MVLTPFSDSNGYYIPSTLTIESGEMVLLRVSLEWEEQEEGDWKISTAVDKPRWQG